MPQYLGQVRKPRPGSDGDDKFRWIISGDSCVIANRQKLARGLPTVEQFARSTDNL
jgi:hypothetical protein